MQNPLLMVFNLFYAGYGDDQSAAWSQKTVLAKDTNRAMVMREMVAQKF